MANKTLRVKIAVKRKVISLAYLSLPLLLLSTLIMFSSAPLSASEQVVLNEHTKVVKLDLGEIKSIVVPTSWQVEDNKDKQFGGRCFSKASSSLDDCEIVLQIGKSIDSNEVALSDKELGLSVGNANSVSVISGKSVRTVEQRSTSKGPCQATANGGSRMPLLTHVKGRFLIGGAKPVQIIQYDVTVMGDTKPCTDSIWAALRSIEWRK